MLTLRLLGGLSLEDDSGALTGRATQKRRLALLALLARAPGRTLTRDKLIGYLWPESDTEQSRHLLSVALYEIRKSLGEELLASRGDDVCLSAERVRVDAEEFERALEAGELERGLELYAGPMLDGFFLSDAPEFERWVDGERERLERRRREAMERLAEQRAAAGERRGAAEAWRQLAALDPYSSRVAAQLMRALAAAGDRAGALQHARVHELLLREEYGTEPDAEVTALAARLREEPAAEPPPEPVAPPPPAAPGAAALVAEAAVPALPPTVEGDSLDPLSPPAPRRVPRALRLTLAGALAGMLLLAAVWMAATGGRLSAGGRSSELSVAVLPFQDLSPARDNEWFSVGLTDEITSALSRVEGVQVAARTSVFAFKDAHLHAREVGARLEVGSLLEGSVRKAGDHLRVVVQLVDVRSGDVLWTESYDRPLGDVFAVQEDIARSVVNRLKGSLVRGDSAALARAATPDLEAYQLYLRGRHAWYQRTGEGFQRAIVSFQEAIRRDPDYALAYVGLADVFILLGAYDYGVRTPLETFPVAKDALRRALQLDPNSAEAHAALANVHNVFDWDWEAADRGFRHAIQLNPGYAPAHHWYALHLVARGRHAEGLAAIRRARELEPLSLVMSTGLARVHYFARQYDRSVEEYRRAIEMDSTFVTARLGLGLAYVQAGDLPRAVQEYQAALRFIGQPQPVVVALLAHAQALAGRTAEARAALRQLTAAAERAYVAPEYLALVHLGLGEHDQALRWLERAYQNRSTSLIFLRVEPLLDPLRSHPGFAALQSRVGV